MVRSLNRTNEMSSPSQAENDISRKSELYTEITETPSDSACGQSVSTLGEAERRGNAPCDGAPAFLQTSNSRSPLLRRCCDRFRIPKVPVGSELEVRE